MKKIHSSLSTAAATLLLISSFATNARATALADQPVFANTDIPGNLALALSVEFPTAISIANTGNYLDNSTYLGYFDPQKCYTYVPNLLSPTNSYFQPTSMANGTNNHFCSGLWSGNFMNWAAMPTIDPFRWALTGGYRSVDTTTTTILEKAWGSNQGSVGSNYPYRGDAVGSGNQVAFSLVSQLTPFTAWPHFDLGIWGNGNAMVFSGGVGFTVGAAAAVNLADNGLIENNPAAALLAWKVYVRVKVCDATTSLGTALLESNCQQYPPVGTFPMPSVVNYKPEGLMQQYSNKIRFSVFGYLNQGGDVRQGGALREPMGYIGPTYPVPLSSTVATNYKPEWDAYTGVQSINPDPTSASASGVSQSGVMNYLNKFGEYGQTYKTYDNVSELYYAAVRYYENLGNVPEWTNGATATALDGFPAVATWTGNNSFTGQPNDPIAYSCQKNFILGIGDDHTWYDYNVGGDTNASGSRPMPAAVAADTINKASLWTTDLETLEGITLTPWWSVCCTNSTYFIAGLAYGVHVNDIRTDLPGPQTISTFWMDVAENQEVENLNPYYLATKYGGLNVGTVNQLEVPAVSADGPVYNMLTPLHANNKQWDTTGATVYMNGYTHPLPDNYFVANNAQAMVTGLNTAFTQISRAAAAFTTSFSFSAPNVTTSTESFASSYTSSGGWSGTVLATTLTFPGGVPTQSAPIWTTNTTYQAQIAGTGWQTARYIYTWNGTQGVPFEAASISGSELTALTPYTCVSANCKIDMLSYIRGDQSNEVGASAGTQTLRPRSLVLGDVVNATLTPVGAPIQTFSDATNTAYASFKSAYASRPLTVYAGANDGMLHAFDGGTGNEVFAYVPSALFQGPNNTPQVDGLAELGNPTFVHHFYVDATPNTFDIDFTKAGTPVPTATPSATTWHSVLIGGLGKGGKSYYALDITDPTTMSTEAASVVQSKVLWEFTDPTMGFSYGAAVVVKTLKYGWVAILTSGYNNADGYGYLYFVNPQTGALLEKVKTPSASSGLTQASAFVKDYSDDTADSIYVGDLNGQLWRFDLTEPASSSAPYPAPVLLAKLTDGSTPQPITTAPLIEIHPVTRQRYVMVGTGKLLASSDVISGQQQSFYVLIDGTAAAFVPYNAVTMPYTRAGLVSLTNTDLVATSPNVIPAAKYGWYTDLGFGSGIGWRVIVNPQAYNGIVTFTTLLTTSTDPCNPSGSSRVYALDYSTAQSVLTPSPLAYVSYTASVIDVRYAGANGNPEIIVGFSAGNPPFARVPANLTGTLATRILNWREVPTVE